MEVSPVANGSTMSAKDKEIAISGDAGQAEGLLGKKKTYGGKKSG